MIQVQLKLDLRPAQQRMLNRWLRHLTGAYNWALGTIQRDAARGIYRSEFELLPLVNGHGAKIGVAQDALSGAIGDAHKAWKRCFSRLSRRPRRKGKRNKLNGITFPHGKDLKVEAKRVKIPVIGRVRYHRQEIPAGRVSYARIVRRASGWYLCLCIKADPVPIAAVLDGVVGVDPGFSSLLTLSTGEVIEQPHELRMGASRLGQAQRGGRRRLAARLHERMRNRRKDRNHKLSRRLVQENALIAWSKDRTRSLQRTFGKSVAGAAHFQLRQYLSYKCRAGGRQFLEVDSRNSTRTCSACGARSGPTGYAGLKVRQWSCACGARHDRDVNAAMNTLRVGLETSHERVGDDSSGIAA
jgi:putative transposase